MSDRFFGVFMFVALIGVLCLAVLAGLEERRRRDESPCSYFSDVPIRNVPLRCFPTTKP